MVGGRVTAARAQRPPIEAWVAIGALVFLGVGGLYGGVAMLSDTSGGALGMDVVLPELPVDSYLLPGLFLLSVMGVLPLLLAWGLVTRRGWPLGTRLTAWTGRHWAWAGSILLSAVLAVFLTVQAAYIGFVWPIQFATAAVGLLVGGTVLLPRVRGHYEAGA